jgi:hypothetical protein
LSRSGFRKRKCIILIGCKKISELCISWAAYPLIDYETVLEFIKTTKTSAGQKIRAAFCAKKYQKGIRLYDKQLSEVNLKH